MLGLHFLSNCCPMFAELSGDCSSIALFNLGSRSNALCGCLVQGNSRAAGLSNYIRIHLGRSFFGSRFRVATFWSLASAVRT